MVTLCITPQQQAHPPPLNTLGPPAAHHLKDVSVAGRWLSDLVCLLHTVRGGIGPFTCPFSVIVVN